MAGCLKPAAPPRTRRPEGLDAPLKRPAFCSAVTAALDVEGVDRVPEPDSAALAAMVFKTLSRPSRSLRELLIMSFLLRTSPSPSFSPLHSSPLVPLSRRSPSSSAARSDSARKSERLAFAAASCWALAAVACSRAVSHLLASCRLDLTSECLSNQSELSLTRSFPNWLPGKPAARLLSLSSSPRNCL